MRIAHLKIRVKVTSGKQDKAVHGKSQAKKPGMEFQAPALKTDATPGANMEPSTGPHPEHGAEAVPGPTPNQVADKVYDIMLQELRIQKMRGGA